MSQELDLNLIKEIDAARTPGRWWWYGNLRSNSLYLATVALGRQFVMRFIRWGMQGAQPMLRFPSSNGDDVFMKPAAEIAVGHTDHNSEFSLEHHPDARFIASASWMVPALIREVERLRDVLRRIVTDAPDRIYNGEDAKDDEYTEQEMRDELLAFIPADLREEVAKP